MHGLDVSGILLVCCDAWFLYLVRLVCVLLFCTTCMFQYPSRLIQMDGIWCVRTGDSFAFYARWYRSSMLMISIYRRVRSYGIDGMDSIGWCWTWTHHDYHHRRRARASRTRGNSSCDCARDVRPWIHPDATPRWRRRVSKDPRHNTRMGLDPRRTGRTPGGANQGCW